MDQKHPPFSAADRYPFATPHQNPAGRRPGHFGFNGDTPWPRRVVISCFRSRNSEAAATQTVAQPLGTAR